MRVRVILEPLSNVEEFREAQKVRKERNSEIALRLLSKLALDLALAFGSILPYGFGENLRI